MKKKYVKPEAIFESFELSSSIAAGCGAKVNHTENTCTYDLGTGLGTLFNNDNSACTFKDQGDNGYCYHVPSDASKLFSS